MKLAHRSHYRDHAELVVRTLPLPSPPLGLEAAGDSAGVGSGPGGWMADALRVHSLKSFIAPKQPGGCCRRLFLFLLFTSPRPPLYVYADLTGRT
jgi:hypothetical protein